MSRWHFPSAALLLQIQGRKDCQSLTSAVFSLSLSSVQHVSPAKKMTEQSHRDSLFSRLQTFRCKQHMWGRWQDESIPTQWCLILFLLCFSYRRNTRWAVRWLVTVALHCMKTHKLTIICWELVQSDRGKGSFCLGLFHKLPAWCHGVLD